MSKFSFGKFSGRNKGQVAIAILFVVAIALIFYAFTQNVGKMSQTKELVTMASNTATAGLASAAASYGQQLYKTNLGGEKKKCGLTGAFAALIGVLIAIVGSVLAIFTFGAGIALSVVGVALAAGGLAINTMIIEPMISNAWTKMMKELLTDNERYIETSLLTALQIAATDPVRIPDLLDLDGDRRFVGAGDSKRNKDDISRFAVLYQKRVKEMAAGGYVAKLGYLDAMERFVYGDVGVWSVTDKPGEHCKFDVGDPLIVGNHDPMLVPSECNPCCLPPDKQTDGGVDYFLIAKSCSGIPEPGGPALKPGYRSASCNDATPYPGYPYVFDKHYQDPWNTHISFLEALGRDDQHEEFNRRFFEAELDDDLLPNVNAVVDPNTGVIEQTRENYADKYGHPDQIPQADFDMHTGVIRYYFGDVDGYYLQPKGNDGKSVHQLRSVFPFFWQAKHFGLDLNTLTMLDRKYPEVVWCDWDNANNRVKAPDGTDSDSTPSVDENGDGNPYNDYVDPDLSVDFDGDGDPTNDINALVCVKAYEDMVVMNEDKINGKVRVEQLDLGSMEGVLYETTCFVDGPASNVGSNPPLGVDNVNEVNKTYLKLLGVNLGNPAENTWSEGSPFYSSQKWPYQYAKYYKWDQMDRMDWIYYGLQEYLVWATHVLSNKSFSASQMEAWEADFIEWRARLESVNETIIDTKGLIEDWMEEKYTTPGCQGAGAAWCIPADPSACQSPVPSGELATFGEGKIEDVVACLEWNSDPTIGGLGGNAERFNACLTACNKDACTDLPRSLVPDFNPNVDPTTFDNDCSDTGSNEVWVSNMKQSIIEAQKQSIKMAMRAKFLRSLIDRRDYLWGVLVGGEINITKMVRMSVPGAASKKTASVIYGWKDEDNKELGLDGRWHYVQVDAKMKEKLPWIRTYNKGIFKSKRCYELTDTDGSLQVKVTRFDAPYDTVGGEEAGGKLNVKFANDKLLWKFWTINPLDAQKVANLEKGIAGFCKANGAYAREGNGSTKYIEGAFITSPGESCGSKLLPALALGVSSCTSANYGFQDEQGGGGANHLNGGFAFTFGKCQ